MDMIILYIFILIIILLLVMPLKVRIIRDNDLKTGKKDNNIDIFLIKIFNLRFDLDDFLTKFIKTKDDKLSLRVILESSLVIKKNKNVIKTLARLTMIEKITLCYKVNNVGAGFLAWNSIYYLRNKLGDLFISIDNEYYNVIFDDEATTDILFELVFYTRLIHIVYAYLINIKDFLKMKKRKKEVL